MVKLTGLVVAWCRLRLLLNKGLEGFGAGKKDFKFNELI